ncbi:hypothetical protein KUV28_05850, partial [Ferrimonas balearica]|nr:hypothetical protein [Ferrimonas balearica]
FTDQAGSSQGENRGNRHIFCMKLNSQANTDSYVIVFLSIPAAFRRTTGAFRPATPDFCRLGIEIG